MGIRIKSIVGMLIIPVILLGLVSEISAQDTDFSYSKKRKMEKQKSKYGLEGSKAPELSKTIEWIDGKGEAMSPIQLKDWKGKFKVIYGFQSWCPGCHSRGLPALKKMVDALNGNDQVKFVAIQTVFEGAHSNTKDKIIETQSKYDLEIPFGHDLGNAESGNRSFTMNSYRTGGTPWFIFIDQNDTVVFNDYHLNVEEAIEYLRKNTTFK